MWLIWMMATAWAGFLADAVKKELKDPALDGAGVSVQVLNHRGRRLVDHEGDMRVVPASTVKWITAIAAADRLGLDYRFHTRFAASGYLSGDTIVGDVVLIGSGDPSFGPPDEELTEAVRSLQRAGIREVRGRVLVASDVIADGPLGEGWMWDDLRFGFSAPFGSINLGHNVMQRGLEGCESVDDGRRTPLVNPDACAATVLHDMLTKAGIRVRQGPGVAPRPDGVLVDLVTWDSPPLRDLLEVMLQRSDNLYAESIVRALDTDGPRTFAGASEVLDSVLERAGVEQIALADGSGLSRYSLVSAGSLARVTHWAMVQPYGEQLMALLARMGRSGTLEGRGKGTPADGRVWAKTGSMRGVRNITGVAYDKRGRALRFAVLFNGLTVSRAEAIRVQDRIIALIAASRGWWVQRKDRIAALAEGD